MGIPTGSFEWPMFGGGVYFDLLDISAAIVAVLLIVCLGLFLVEQKLEEA